VPDRPERRRAGPGHGAGDPDDDAGGPPARHPAGTQNPGLRSQRRSDRPRKPRLCLKPPGDGTRLELSSPAGLEQVEQPVTGDAAADGSTFTGQEGLRGTLAPLVSRGLTGDGVDAANMILFLASSAAGWITGQTIPADGGYSLAL